MSDVRNDDEPPKQQAGGNDLSDAGQQFDEELHDAEAEADDTFRE